MKPIKLIDAQMDAALGLETTMNHEATGNLKCWHVIDRSGEKAREGLTKSQAMQMAHTIGRAQYCRDGFKLVVCAGAAHDNPHIDNCMQCAPRWGWVMVPIESEPEDKRELTHVEKTLLGALK